MKYDYSVSFGKMTDILCAAAKYADGKAVKHLHGQLSALADEAASELLHSIAADFITPINRADMAATVLALRRTVAAVEAVGRGGNYASKGELTPLADAVAAYTAALFRLRKERRTPSADAYFKAAAGVTPTKVNAGAYECLCDCCETVICAILNNI